jgi:ankyrin repeat protein
MAPEEKFVANVKILPERAIQYYSQSEEHMAHPLWQASHDGDARAVDALLADERLGLDVNQAEEHGVTPLLIASEEGHAEVVSMLLAKQGVDIRLPLIT